MDYPSQLYTNAHDTYYLPPRTVPLKVKQSKAWKKSMMDAFEHIAIEQFKENLQFVDYYRMYEGKMSFQELSEAVPHLDGLQDLLDGVGIPSFLRHYDILGVIVNALVGQYLTFREKYHVTDTGEVAQNEYLRYKDEQAQKLLTAVIENTVKMGLAKSGFDPDSNQKFESPEEQQAYMMKLQQMEESLIPKDTMRAKSSSFKSLGVQWGEATLDHDKIRFDFNSLEKEEFKHYLLSGRPVRHYHITKDSYKPETWDSKAVFTSKEIAGKQVQKGEFAGRLHFFTPSEVVGRWPHLIDSKTQKQLMGGNRQWKTHIHDGFANGSINDAVKNNFNKQVRVPFSNFFDYRTSLALQDDLDIPMGIQTIFNDDGTTTERNRYLPRLQGDYHGRYTGYARILRDDFSHRRDLCQVTEVYFRAYDLWGYFTYVNEEGMVVTEEVTEEILPEFIKENNIKQKYNQRLVDIVEDFKPGEIQWIYRPYTYEGVKIQSENLEEPLYLKVQKCEHQIFGDDEWETILPVAGLVGKPIAAKIEPYQSKYNLCMNQIFQLLEKELGMFFLMSTEMIPSEFEEWGDAEEAMIALRNIAKSVGIMPMATTNDGQGPSTVHNQVASYNLSNSSQIRDRIEIAEFNRRKAFETIGIKPSMTEQPTKYETAEGIRTGQEASFAQISDIFEEFNLYVKGANEVHLSVAQYCQSNRKDGSLYYTKSDGSLAFLEMSDPSFPLRRIGIIVAQSSAKRKEMETFRSYILNTNTLGSDTLEIAKLISSDDMSDMIEIARVANERRAMQEQERADRDRQLVERKGEIDRQIQQEADARAAEQADLDRATKIKVAEVQALGRAADKQSDQEGFEKIEKAAADDSFNIEKFRHKQEMDRKEFERRDKEQTEGRKLKIEELTLKAKQLEERVKERESKERIALINKN